MNEKLTVLLGKIDELEKEIEAELAHRREQFRFTIRDKTVRFEQGALEAQRRLKRGIVRFLLDAGVRSYATSPFIYALILPIGLLDLFLAVYQRICFPVYGIPRVPRERYIVFDRHHLAYLNAIEKLNCVYCGYANGVIALAREVGSRTEQYWCPIKHARRVTVTHKRYAAFLEYGDAQGYRERLGMLRDAVRKEEGPEQSSAEN
jgi:hypothetical protein